MNFRPHRISLLLPLAALVALGACRDREPEEQPEMENNASIDDSILNSTGPIINETMPENVQVAPKHAPPPEIPDEQQILDDAAAVGMTSRIDRSAQTNEPPAAPEKPEDMAKADGEDLNQIY